MVGVRIMANSGADGREGVSLKRSHQGKLVNGERTPRGDAAPSGKANTSAINGASTAAPDSTTPAHKLLDELPPELVHIASENYHPLSRLLERISLECFNDLQAVLGTMADLQVTQPTNGAMVNGQGGYAHATPDTSEANKQKKMLLMQFAQGNRAKFIKLLVLTQWGKKSSADLSKLIDLFAWAKEQEMQMNAVDGQIENFKTALSQARQYNPDIRTALQVLSTRKAGWIPHLGYVPPEPMTPTKSLQLLKYLNTTASIRLNVHEELPRHLKKWRVASGRAVFTVAEEFEMELLTFTEQPTEQWHFIDLRLLFSPAPVVDAGSSRFWANFKPRVDLILRESGISGCFDYLHNFVLTHKIAILKSQAYQLARAGWAGAIKVESVHRMLVVQYWMEKPGRKSWIEIGISSCRPKNGKLSWRGPPVSTLTIRWFRQGGLVTDHDLDVDFANLSMERILKNVVAFHTTHLLRSTRDALSPSLTTKEQLSLEEPCDCSLQVSLGRPENTTTLSIEPVTGRFILRPFTLIPSRAEQAINQSRDPAANHATTLTQLLAQTLQDTIQRHAHQLGWRQQTRQALKLDAVKQNTKANALQYSLYWPRGWPTKWGLASVIDPSGETWWFLELGARGARIDSAEQLHRDRSGAMPPISRATLASIERVAVQQLALFVTRRECDRRRMPCIMSMENAKPPALPQKRAVQRFLRGWVLQLRTTDLIKTKPGEEPWLESTIRVTCQGMKGDYRNVSHIASGTMVKSVAADMKKLMASSPQDHFTFSENGNFSILLTTPFGEEVLTELSARLKDLDRLRSLSTTLQKRKMKLRSSSLQHVTFQYGRSCTATVNFSKHDDIRIDFSPGSPHNRIRTHLTEMINERSPFHVPGSDKTGLDQFCATLMFTRPILFTLAELENGAQGHLQNPKVHVHDIRTYRVTYSNPLCSFDVKLRSKDDKVLWHIEDNDKKPQDSKPSAERSLTRKRLDSVKTALATLFRSRGEGWFGVRFGILASIDGIPKAVKALHEAITSCAVPTGSLPYIEVQPAPSAPRPPNNAPGGGNQAPNGHPKGPPPAHKGGQNFPVQANAGKQANQRGKQDVIEID